MPKKSPARSNLLNWCLIAASCVLVCGCHARKSVRCFFADIPANMQSADAATRGKAAECALAKSPASLSTLVPVLLNHLSDQTVYRTYYSGGGLIGFGEAGERSLSVGQVSLQAVRKAAPTKANIEPIVTALIAAANAMQSTEYVGLYGDPSTTAVALTDLLALEFSRAGLVAEVASTLTRQLPRLSNPALTEQTLMMPTLRSLAGGVVPQPYGPSTTTAANSPPKASSQSRFAKRGLTWGFKSASTGSELVSRAYGDGLCRSAEGEDWRMAEHHDGDWGISARGSAPAPIRLWVAINDQAGNCWDP
jgi:hypothetical protein